MKNKLIKPNGVSVIIPFYREINYLGCVIASVLDNLCDNLPFEILLCNDGNLDDKAIREATKIDKPDILKILRNEFKKGPGGARNTGLKYAKYNVVAFLDADDKWLAGKLVQQLECYREGATFISTDYALDNGATINAPTTITSPEDIFFKRGLGTSTILVCRNLIGDSRFRDLRFGQDIDFWYKLAKKRDFKYQHVPFVGVHYSTGGSTSNKFVQLWHMGKVMRVNNVTIYIFLRFICSYIINGIINHYGYNLFFKYRRKNDDAAP